MPSLNVLDDGVICYADAVVGAGSEVNFLNNGTVYSLHVPTPCPTEYEISYSCGSGATGTPPQVKSIEYGTMLGIGYDYGTCSKTGYYADGWTLDGVVKSAGTYLPFEFIANKTLSVRWSPSTYSAVYICNNDTINSEYLHGAYL